MKLLFQENPEKIGYMKTTRSYLLKDLKKEK